MYDSGRKHWKRIFHSLPRSGLDPHRGYQCFGSGPGGSVINWLLGSGCIIRNYEFVSGSGLSKIPRNRRKKFQYFLKFDDLMLNLSDNIFYPMATKVQAGSGWIRNLLASLIRIRYSGLRIRGSGSERNIYGSTTVRDNYPDTDTHN